MAPPPARKLSNEIREDNWAQFSFKMAPVAEPGSFFAESWFWRQSRPRPQRLPPLRFWAEILWTVKGKNTKAFKSQLFRVVWPVFAFHFLVISWKFGPKRRPEPKLGNHKKNIRFLRSSMEFLPRICTLQPIETHYSKPIREWLLNTIP